jgi:hypothetical protein
MQRIIHLATAAVAAVTLIASPAASVPVGATVNATAKAQVVKPLTLTAKSNLDFGTVLLTSVAAGTTYTVTLTSAGALSCTAGLTCSNTGIPATFNVTGSKQQLVHIYTSASNFTNGTTTLQVTPSAQTTLTLANSGAPGSDFKVGASFPIDSNTTDGLYTGNLNVTVDYN